MAELATVATLMAPWVAYAAAAPVIIMMMIPKLKHAPEDYYPEPGHGQA